MKDVTITAAPVRHAAGGKHIDMGITEFAVYLGEGTETIIPLNEKSLLGAVQDKVRLFRHSRQFGLWNQGARHTAVAHPEDSGGWTFHHLCHALEEACILLDCYRARRVYHMNQVSAPDTPSEEIVNSLVTMENGTTVLLTDGTSIGGFEDMGIQGEGGDLRLLGNTLTVIRPGPPDPTGRPGNLSRLIKSCSVPSGGKMFETVADKFAQAIRGGKNELLSFRFVGNQYRILNAMRESAKTGKSVDL